MLIWLQYVLHLSRIQKAHVEWGFLSYSVWNTLERVGDRRHCNSGPIILWHYWYLLICTKPGQTVSDYHPLFSNGFSVFNFLKLLLDEKMQCPFLTQGAPFQMYYSFFLYFIKNLTQVSFFIKVEHDGAKEVIVRKNPFVDVVNHSVETRTLWFWCRITRDVSDSYLYVFQNYTWRKTVKLYLLGMFVIRIVVLELECVESSFIAKLVQCSTSLLNSC